MTSKEPEKRLKTTKEVAKRALAVAAKERSGQQLGLKSRFGKLNVAMGKYLRFGSVTSISGLSGHGKSYMLNILIQDFLNNELNHKCIYDFMIAAHTFEMLPEDEMLRSISGKLGKSYMYLLSSEFNKDTKKYNTLTDEEYLLVKKLLASYEKDPICYFDEPTTLSGIGKNCNLAIEYYQEEFQTTKKPKLIVPIDHTLLIKPSEGEKGILEMMRSLASVAVMLKKRGYMVILLGQLNNNIERIERIRNPEGHYPIKSDIYAQGEIFNACDCVMTTHQPSMLGITHYGLNKLPTKDLFHLQILKQRFGKIGSIWLQNSLSKGTLIPYTEEQQKKQIDLDLPQ